MNKKGFTLIEIIIVVVILGILATMAVPRLTAQIEASRAAEAVYMLGFIKRAAMNCYDASSTMANCLTSDKLGVQLPAAGVTLFDYALTNSGANELRIIALRNTAQNHTGSADCLKMRVQGNLGLSELSGYGAYEPTVARMAVTAAANTTVDDCTVW